MESIIGKQYPKIVIPKIDSAKSTIKIVVFDWRWYPDDPGNIVSLFNQAIVRAVRRGVMVSCIVNNEEIVNILNQVGCNAKRLVTKNLVHAKLMIIDDQIVIVGSHNYSQSAFTTNFEVSTLHDDVETAKSFLDFFNNLYNNY